MNNTNFQEQSTWGAAEPVEALHQVAGLCQKVAPLELKVSSDGSSFHLSGDDKILRKGILSARGKLTDDSVILVKIEVFRGPNNIQVSSNSFFKHLSALGGKTRIIPPPEKVSEHSTLWVELKVKASPMSMTRSGAFFSELKNIDKLARILQAELPVIRTDFELVKLYKNFAETLEPVHPWQADGSKAGAMLLNWARETIDFLTGSSCVAIASSSSSTVNIALAAMALASQEVGRSLGQLIFPAISAKRLVELTRKAPGTIVVPAVKVSLGTSPYELGNAMQALLASLSDANRPVVFTGRYEELQLIFHGGQGGMSDPLIPVLRHIPDVPLEILTRFTIQSDGRLVGGLPKSVEEELTRETLDAVQNLSPNEQKRILPVVSRRTVNMRAATKKTAMPPVASFASTVSGISETLAGLSPRPRVSRSPDVQERFTKVLTDPELLPFIQEHLLAQDYALEQLVSRLRMECLTRPLHQPIRYCAQGTPATGKSESAALLAQRLGIPHINIDAASMPDYHTAAAQLLGSGRGIVGSHQSGRLEQAAKHHAGVLVEVSDLDHASPFVRSALADLFLQILENGEAQSSVGAMFSCANLIFAFTMNLPGGMDETVRKGIGFNNAPSRGDINKRVVSEIKMMLSGAFLSRIGTPILFEPLDGEALAAIIERAIKRAILSAADRLHSHIQEVILEAGTGLKVISSLETSIASFGARALLEHGRSMAAEAFTKLQQGGGLLSGKTLLVTATSDGKVNINPL